MKKEKDFFSLLLISVVTLLSPSAFAQSDWGMWTTVETKHSLVPKKVQLGVGIQLHSKNNFTTLDKIKGMAELDYKFNRHFKIGVGYELIYNHHKNEYEYQNKGIVKAATTFGIGRLDISMREQFQATRVNVISSSSSRINPKMYLRSKIKVKYDIPKSKLEPYVSGELYYFLTPPKDYVTKWTKIRYTAGCEWNIDKRNSIELFYRYARTYDSDDDDYDPANVIGIGYALSF
ncbi:MAG: DUF2490 domain-containing protein [Bacteroidales bacterium]|jgi:long-subunit fatty acid transport protein|nr:DUF2490 domain-containing protein [Bacteroidales bacterium]MCI2146162.1 DUF2490 domain-containing protein [Bacteroidales bacterium]